MPGPHDFTVRTFAVRLSAIDAAIAARFHVS
jgi:hypothetical protein